MSGGRLAWVVGRGGLLGSALERVLLRNATVVFVPDQRFAWDRPALLVEQLEEALHDFADRASTAERWEIHWAAGVGTMGSVDEALVTETTALEALLAAVERSNLLGARGRLSLASSAGAIYAGSTEAVIDERTIEVPTTPYARAKLLQERLVRECAARCGVGLLIGRISTLYGAGQGGAKQQGLLTHMARCLLRNQPIRIFVPLDTIRDYIAADEAAMMMVEALALVGPGSATMKIVASEQPTTISEIVSIFKRIARRPPLIVTSGSPASSRYTRRIQFRSIVPPLRSGPPMNLLAGVGQILAAERLRYVTCGRGTGAP